MQAAENYARSGWYVFPLIPRDKKPLTSHGVKDASCKIDVIRRWWERWPNANIGLSCGPSHIVAIDLDEKKDKSGSANWKAIVKRLGLNIKTSSTHTGGGGQHLLFAAPEGVEIKNQVSQIAPGVDIRSEGGYIVLPPSIHPTGQPYTWTDTTSTVEILPNPIIDILTKEVDPWQVFTLRDAFAPRDPLVWLVEGIITAGSLNIWYGAPGSYKSMLLADMALCVASGQNWLSEPGKPTTGIPTTPGAVMWLDFDNGARRTHERFAALARARHLNDATPIYYVSMPTPTLLAADDDSIRSLATRMVNLNIALLVVDNLGTITADTEENSADMQKPMTNLRWLAETGAAVNVIHHQRKASEATKTARAGEGLRGHGSIEASLDLAMLVMHDGLNVIAKPTKTRGSIVTEVKATFSGTNDSNNELLEARFWPGDAMLEKEQAQEQKNLRQLILEELRANGPMSANAMFDALGGNRNHLLDVLRQMNLEKLLAKKPNPRGGFLLTLP